MRQEEKEGWLVWLRERDQNTTSYYAMLKQKQYQNRINAIQYEQRQLLADMDDIGNHIVNHCKISLQKDR